MRGTAADDGVLKSLVETQKVIQRQLASLQECVKQPQPQTTPSPSERETKSQPSEYCMSPLPVSGSHKDPIARTSPFVRILLVETEIEGLMKVQDRRRVLGQPIQFAQSGRLYIWRYKLAGGSSRGCWILDQRSRYYLLWRRRGYKLEPSYRVSTSCQRHQNKRSWDHYAWLWEWVRYIWTQISLYLTRSKRSYLVWTGWTVTGVF